MLGGAAGQTDSVSGRKPQAIRSALAVLQAVVATGPGVTAKEISHLLSIPPATTYRLLNLLVGEEYLVRLPDLRGFALGASYANLAPSTVPAGSPATEPVPSGILPALDALRSETGLATCFARFHLDTIHSVVADVSAVRTSDAELNQSPYASAVGKLMLAANPEWRARLPSTLTAHTASTITNLGQLDDLLLTIRTSHLAIQVDELRAGTSCIAAAIRDADDTICGGVTVTGPTSSITTRLQSLMESVKRASVAISSVTASAT
jgi:DNA-binding IclR family transcriptional regulator